MHPPAWQWEGCILTGRFRSATTHECELVKSRTLSINAVLAVALAAGLFAGPAWGAVNTSQGDGYWTNAAVWSDGVPANWIDIDSLIAIKERIDDPRHKSDVKYLKRVREMRDGETATGRDGEGQDS